MSQTKADLTTIMQWSQWLQVEGGTKTVVDAMVKLEMNAEEKGQAIDQLVRVSDSTPALRRMDDLFANIAEQAKSDEAAREAVENMSDEALAKLSASQAGLGSMTAQLIPSERVPRILAVTKDVRSADRPKLKADEFMTNLWTYIDAGDLTIEALWDTFGATLFAWVIVNGLLMAEEMEEDADADAKVRDRDVVLKLSDAIVHPEEIGDMREDSVSVLNSLYECSVRKFGEAYRLAQRETPVEIEEELWELMQKLMDNEEAGEDDSAMHGMVTSALSSLF